MFGFRLFQLEVDFEDCYGWKEYDQILDAWLEQSSIDQQNNHKTGCGQCFNQSNSEFSCSRQPKRINLHNKSIGIIGFSLIYLRVIWCHN